LFLQEWLGYLSVDAQEPSARARYGAAVAKNLNRSAIDRSDDIKKIANDARQNLVMLFSWRVSSSARLRAEKRPVAVRHRPISPASHAM
jgi:hypothetical protein